MKGLENGTINHERVQITSMERGSANDVAYEYFWGEKINKTNK